MPKSCRLNGAAEESTESQLDLSVLPLHKQTRRVFRMDFEELDKPRQSPEIVTLADQDRDFQKEPKGLTDLPAATALKAVGAELLALGSPSTQGRAELYGHGHADLGVSGQQVQHIPCVHSRHFSWLAAQLAKPQRAVGEH